MIRIHTPHGVRLWLLILCILCAALLVGIAVFPSVDTDVSAWMIEHQGETGITIMQIISFFGSAVGVLILAIVFADAIARKERYRALAFYFTSVIGGILLGLLLKILIQRERPLNPYELSFAFPSGHATAAMAAYGALAFVLWPDHRRIATLVLLAPFVVAFSRIYLHVHWLSDVVGGMLLGSIWLLTCIWIFYRTEIKAEQDAAVVSDTKQKKKNK